MSRSFIVTADGGSRGNPGPAGYGAVVTEGNHILLELFEAIGIASNNVAEYRGLIAALEAINELDPNATVDVRMDSKLVVEQMSGRWQIKHPDMRELAKRARDAHPANLVTYRWIPRDENSHADRLANKAMDGEIATTNVPLQKNFLTERVVSGEKPTTIFLVRHGETILTPDRRFSGGDGSDPGLSETGRKQASAIALELAARKPDVLIASPLLRTRQTAEIIQGMDSMLRKCKRSFPMSGRNGFPRLPLVHPAGSLTLMSQSGLNRSFGSWPRPIPVKRFWSSRTMS